MNIPQLLVDKKFAKDIYWGEQFIKHGLITLNGTVLKDYDVELKNGDDLRKIGIIIQVGKRKWAKVINTDAEL